MARATLLVSCLLLVLLPLLVRGKPMGGKFTGNRGFTQVLSSSKGNNATYHSLTLNNNGRISLKVKRDDIDTDSSSADRPVQVEVIIYRSKCANYLECSPYQNYCTKLYSSSVSLNSGTVHHFTFPPLISTPPPATPAAVAPPVTVNITDGNATDEGNSSTEGNGNTKREVSLLAEESSDTKVEDEPTHFHINRSAVYIVLVSSSLESQADKSVAVKFDLEMKNTFGYLSALDYPALVFYGLMTTVYAMMALAWSIAMCCSYKDLIRLQFWLFGVILLGFLEKTFFASEYGSINTGEDSSFLILVAETISAAKRALARVILVIVSLGFGTVKPRLGDSLGKVVAMGLIYFTFALIDGIVRARADTFDTQDTSQAVTFGLLFIMDSIIFYWIFTSLVSVRRALRLRKNYVKLSMYNHFAYTLIFALVAALAFLIWEFVEVNYPKDGCLKDWKEVWLRECFWHFLFCFILIVIMIIWRPSANRNRFAYSLVNDVDEEEEEECGENKNFETVKMRSIGKSDATPPPVSTQAEDDLRWVEENLPTTAMDKALPLILDSDEEIMNTKFEASKMN